MDGEVLCSCSLVLEVGLCEGVGACEQPVVWGLVLCDFPFGGDVVVHGFVPVQVVGSDVEDDGDFGMEFLGVCQLEAAHFYDVVGCVPFYDLEAEAFADVSGEGCRQVGGLEEVSDEFGGGAFSVGSGDGDDGILGVEVSPFNVGDDALG